MESKPSGGEFPRKAKRKKNRRQVQGLSKPLRLGKLDAQRGDG